MKLCKAPFNEIIPLVKKICADKIITETELLDLKWTIDNILSENRYYDLITSKIQELEVFFHGILADNTITNDEIKNLEQWLFDNEELVGTYPCWAFSCYGRKVEEAMNMRKQGYKISIVKEIDFIDATIE